MTSPNPIFILFTGKSCGKDSPEKKDENDLLWSNVDAQAAFLGPNIWDNKNLPYDTDLKVISYYLSIYIFGQKKLKILKYI